MEESVTREYEATLADLKINSKPHINMLTMLADDNVANAPEIVRLIENRLQKAPSNEKLPTMYLMDSIVKNIKKGPYQQLFAKNLTNHFCGVFSKVNEKTRASLFKLRSTWNQYFASGILHALDVRVQQIDPAWPIMAASVTPAAPAIHINPKFIKKPAPMESTASATVATTSLKQSTVATPTPVPSEPPSDKERIEQEMRQSLIAKQQELLQIQQQRLQLELEETKAKLAAQAREIQEKNEALALQEQKLTQMSQPGESSTLPQQQGPPVSTGILGDLPLPKEILGASGVPPSISTGMSVTKTMSRDPRLARDPRRRQAVEQHHQQKQQQKQLHLLQQRKQEMQQQQLEQQKILEQQQKQLQMLETTVSSLPVSGSIVQTASAGAGLPSLPKQGAVVPGSTSGVVPKVEGAKSSVPPSGPKPSMPTTSIAPSTSTVSSVSPTKTPGFKRKTSSSSPKGDTSKKSPSKEKPSTKAAKLGVKLEHLDLSGKSKPKEETHEEKDVKKRETKKDRAADRDSNKRGERSGSRNYRKPSQDDRDAKAKSDSRGPRIGVVKDSPSHSDSRSRSRSRSRSPPRSGSPRTNERRERERRGSKSDGRRKDSKENKPDSKTEKRKSPSPSPDRAEEEKSLSKKYSKQEQLPPKKRARLIEKEQKEVERERESRANKSRSERERDAGWVRGGSRNYDPPPSPQEQRPPFRRPSLLDPNITIPQELSLPKLAKILEQAEKQLHSGALTHDQHQQLLRELNEIYNIQRIKKEDERKAKQSMQQNPPRPIRDPRDPRMMREQMDPRFSRDPRDPRNFQDPRGMRDPRGLPDQPDPRRPPQKELGRDPRQRSLLEDPRMRKYPAKQGLESEPRDMKEEPGRRIDPAMAGSAVLDVDERSREFRKFPSPLHGELPFPSTDTDDRDLRHFAEHGDQDLRMHSSSSEGESKMDVDYRALPAAFQTTERENTQGMSDTDERQRVKAKEDGASKLESSDKEATTDGERSETLKKDANGDSQSGVEKDVDMRPKSILKVGTTDVLADGPKNSSVDIMSPERVAMGETHDKEKQPADKEEGKMDTDDRTLISMEQTDIQGVDLPSGDVDLRGPMPQKRPLLGDAGIPSILDIDVDTFPSEAPFNGPAFGRGRGGKYNKWQTWKKDHPDEVCAPDVEDNVESRDPRNRMHPRFRRRSGDIRMQGEEDMDPQLRQQRGMPRLAHRASEGGIQEYFDEQTGVWRPINHEGMMENEQARDRFQRGPKGHPGDFPEERQTGDFPPERHPQDFPPDGHPRDFRSEMHPRDFPPDGRPRDFPSDMHPRDFPHEGHPRDYPPGRHPRDFPSEMHPRDFPPEGHPREFPPERDFPPGRHPRDFPQGRRPEDFTPDGAPREFPPEDHPGEFPPEGHPREFPPDGHPREFRPGHPREFSPGHREFSPGHPREFHPEDHPREFPPEGHPREFPPEGHPREFPPEGHPREFPPEGHPREFPPDGHPREFPPGHRREFHPERRPGDFPPEVGPHEFPPRSFPSDLDRSDPRFKEMVEKKEMPMLLRNPDEQLPDTPKSPDMEDMRILQQPMPEHERPPFLPRNIPFVEGPRPHGMPPRGLPERGQPGPGPVMPGPAGMERPQFNMGPRGMERPTRPDAPRPLFPRKDATNEPALGMNRMQRPTGPRSQSPPVSIATTRPPFNGPASNLPTGILSNLSNLQQILRGYGQQLNRLPAPTQNLITALQNISARTNIPGHILQAAQQNLLQRLGVSNVNANRLRMMQPGSQPRPNFQNKGDMNRGPRPAGPMQGAPAGPMQRPPFQGGMPVREGQPGDGPQQMAGREMRAERGGQPMEDMGPPIQGPSGMGQQGPMGVGQQGPPGMRQQGPPGMGQQGPMGMGQQGPPGMRQQGPPGMDQQGQQGLGQQGPPGMGQQGPIGMGQQGQAGMRQQGPPGMDQQGPQGLGQQGPPGMGQQGPIGMGQQGPPGMRQQGPPIMGQQGPPGMSQQGPMGMGQGIRIPGMPQLGQHDQPLGHGMPTFQGMQPGGPGMPPRVGGMMQPGPHGPRMMSVPSAMQGGPMQQLLQNLGMPRPAPPPGSAAPAPALSSQFDINSLFSKLVSSGILKENLKSESPGPQKGTSTPPPVTAGGQSKEEKGKAGNTEVDKEDTESQEAEDDGVYDIPEMSLTSGELKTRHPGLVKRMYSGMQCTSCGQRFVMSQMDRYRKHLDWHFRQNRKKQDGIKATTSRNWYYEVDEWLEYEEINDIEDARSSFFDEQAQENASKEQGMASVPVTSHPNDEWCKICRETFEQFFEEEKEEWHYRDAIRVEERTFHPSCYEDVKDTSALLETSLTEELLSPPLVRTRNVSFSGRSPTSPGPSFSILNPPVFPGKASWSAVKGDEETAGASGDAPAESGKALVVPKIEPGVESGPAVTTSESKPDAAALKVKVKVEPIDESMESVVAGGEMPQPTIKTEPMEIPQPTIKTEPMEGVTVTSEGMDVKTEAGEKVASTANVKVEEMVVPKEHKRVEEVRSNIGESSRVKSSPVPFLEQVSQEEEESMDVSSSQASAKASEIVGEPLVPSKLEVENTAKSSSKEISTSGPEEKMEIETSVSTAVAQETSPADSETLAPAKSPVASNVGASATMKPPLKEAVASLRESSESTEPPLLEAAAPILSSGANQEEGSSQSSSQGIFEKMTPPPVLTHMEGNSSDPEGTQDTPEADQPKGSSIPVLITGNANLTIESEEHTTDS